MNVWIVYQVDLDDTTLSTVRAYSTKALAQAAVTLHGGLFLQIAGPLAVNADADRIRAGLSRFRVNVRQSTGEEVSCEHLGIGTGEPTQIEIDNCYGFIAVTVDAADPKSAALIALNIWAENAKAPLAPTT